MSKLSYADLKLTSEQVAYLKQIATQKWIQAKKPEMTQIWFETLLEHLGQIGYKVVYSEDEF